MELPASRVSPSLPSSRCQQFSTDLFPISCATSSLSKPLTPGETPALQSLSQPASPISYHGNSSTPCSTHQLPLAVDRQQHSSYNESMLTPHRAGYATSPFGTNGFPSAKTTPSFDPEDDVEMFSWTEDETFPLLSPLDDSVLTDEFLPASPTAPTGPTSPPAVRTIPGHNDSWPEPIPQHSEPASPIKKSADVPADGGSPITSRVQRSDWMVSPIVRVQDTENSEVNLPLSIDSTSMAPSITRETGTVRTPNPSSSSLRVERRQRSKSDVGVRGIERDNDGVWCGLSPEMRTGLGISNPGLGTSQGVEYLPMNLKEMEQSEKIYKKNLEVVAWLKKSPALGTEKMGCRGLTVPKRDKRSKSISDFRFETSDVRQSQPENDDMDEDTDSDEEVSARNSSWEEGSLDAWGESVEKSDNMTNSSPPANVEESMSMDPEPEEYYDQNKDPKYLPPQKQFFKPWCDGPDFGGSSGVNQPPTANHAMHRFNRRADHIETASRVATFGSTTMHGLTLEDVFVSPLGRLPFGKDRSKGKEKEKEKEKPPRERKTSMFGFKERTPTNSTQKSEMSQQDNVSIATSPSQKWITGWSPRRSKLSLDTSIVGPAIGQATGQLAAFGVSEESKSATSVGSSTPWSPLGSNSLSPQGTKRTRGKRSKSDLSNTGSIASTKLTKPRPTSKPEVGLVALIQQHGGPPTISITSSPTSGGVLRRHTLGSTTSIPSTVTGAVADTTGVADYSDDDDDDLVVVPTLVQKLDITPTLEGYATHISNLNPHLEQRLVDRIAQEQVKRYKKLQDHQAKHLASLREGGCPNNNQCSALNPQPPSLLTISGGMVGNGGAEEHIDNTTLGAQYPFGVPAPPVANLPAEFECTICFKVKKFNKPSDWTKHVHEDVQPFTCTFPDCPEPKSFKRKADWVRHENEKHRHLEWWKCNQQDCKHVCYRKDNFVQHLVREHKFREPKVKAVKAAMKAKGVKGKKAPASAAAGTVVDPVQEQSDRVMAIVELCHNETKRQPSSESCRFCGTRCTTWKKLTVHLARHMEHISLPILDLIKDDDSKFLVPTTGSSVPPAVAAMTANPTAIAAGGEIASQLNVGGDHFYTQHQARVSTQPSGNISNLFFPTPAAGEIRSQHNPHMPSLASPVPTTSMPMLSSSPPVNIISTYLDPNSFHDQFFMEGQQEGGTGGSGAVEFYPTPSGSVSPYLIPSQHNIYSTTTGGGLLNASDAHYFTVPTPGTTPPLSTHGLPNPQQQNQLGGASSHLDLLSPHLHTHSPGDASSVGLNMAMLNMSLPSTSVSMEQLTLTSGPASTNFTGMSTGVEMGMAMEMGSLEQSRIHDYERFYRANANAVEGNNAPPDTWDGWYSHST